MWRGYTGVEGGRNESNGVMGELRVERLELSVSLTADAQRIFSYAGKEAAVQRPGCGPCP